ncbi:MAG: adenosylcobinamide-phosphate synthase CbiB [Acidobacteriota bacterium]
MVVSALAPSAFVLGLAIVLDLLIGDPSYAFHPVRLMGRTLGWIENILRGVGAEGYLGGCWLFLALSLLWVGGTSVVALILSSWSGLVAGAIHLFLLYSLVALRDLLKHVMAVERAAAAEDLEGARRAISQLVGRDIERMDVKACRRAAIESLSENLVDGFVSPILWYSLLGLPGLVLFKVVSTMDSMVGYKTIRYLRFGWCGARLDDLMNLVPARLTWLLLSLVASILPGCSGRKALLVGWKQHAIVPGPNSGWSEAAAAGALSRRLVGPIWMRGGLVTDIWLGNPADPPAGQSGDVPRACVLVTSTALLFGTACIVSLLR